MFFTLPLQNLTDFAKISAKLCKKDPDRKITCDGFMWKIAEMEKSKIILVKTYRSENRQRKYIQPESIAPTTVSHTTYIQQPLY